MIVDADHLTRAGQGEGVIMMGVTPSWPASPGAALGPGTVLQLSNERAGSAGPALPWPPRSRLEFEIVTQLFIENGPNNSQLLGHFSTLPAKT